MISEHFLFDHLLGLYQVSVFVSLSLSPIPLSIFPFLPFLSPYQLLVFPLFLPPFSLQAGIFFRKKKKIVKISQLLYIIIGFIKNFWDGRG